MSEKKLNILFIIFLLASLGFGALFKYQNNNFLLALSVAFAVASFVILVIWVIRLVKLILKAHN
ncbi:hypothetical protein [Apilactobacillus ozensis]|uniref:Uncharacterized protein n=1 Tax=Apilactobacillus ozensis DSM 23829 = JCM 17196 TaxID=1423781 RepID=A0A0R2AKV3_9LACO|nr:hypothetical protein [Apilactobacillus ozensis]KRM67629.1 hypothetical protein FD06_GL000781 [Apilactobacillus ozensis DSM 23829 = JCM 17196]MCK8607267.1 hypothetical protein [Apilactobacillus ozensis]